ncbi:vacuolar iron transporter homolog 1-like [Wolffia australiana]
MALDELKATTEPDYGKRAQWLRAAALGANDGLVSTASMMLGVGAARPEPGPMVLAGLAGLVAGACSMAIGEFVSVRAQSDVVRAQARREGGDEEKDSGFSAAVKAAAASAAAFGGGAAAPLAAVAFVGSYKGKVTAVAVASTAALAGFGLGGAWLGRAPMGRAVVRAVVGGWLAMAVSFGIMKAVGGFVSL